MEAMEKKVNTVLLIDDDKDDFELVNEAFHDIDPGIAVHFVDRCEDAPKYARKPVDLVLLDINMPYHDGFSWLKGIREKGYDRLPVIMYTNSSSPADISRSYAEGANLYFPKPESFVELKKALQKLIQLDWSNPVLITQNYTRDGQFKTFRA